MNRSRRSAFSSVGSAAPRAGGQPVGATRGDGGKRRSGPRVLAAGGRRTVVCGLQVKQRLRDGLLELVWCLEEQSRQAEVSDSRLSWPSNLPPAVPRCTHLCALLHNLALRCESHGDPPGKSAARKRLNGGDEGCKRTISCFDWISTSAPLTVERCPRSAGLPAAHPGGGRVTSAAHPPKSAPLVAAPVKQARRQRAEHCAEEERPMGIQLTHWSTSHLAGSRDVQEGQP